MQYHYHSHIRNLQDEALLQKRKISAQLYQQNLLKQKQELAETSRSKGFKLKQSRREEDRETAAFLERSRLEAQLSATRTKAQSSMNRSRIQSAFELRRENQKAFQEKQRLNLKHEFMQRRAARQQLVAHQNFEYSKDLVQQKLRQQDRLLKLYQDQMRANELQTAYKYSLLQRQRYYLPY